jgi:hypothetical protein
MSAAIGGGKSKSSNTSQAFNMSESGSTSGSMSSEAIAFEDFYKSLYGKATGVADTALNSNVLNDAARSLFTGGSEFLRSMGADEGTEYLQSRLSGENPAVEDAIRKVQADTGRLFNEELLPGITSENVAGGTLGGSRQGVAQGLATREAGRLFTDAATDIRLGDIRSRDAAAGTIAQNTLTAANTGLGSLPTLLGLLQAGNEEDIGILERFKGILGGPTTLTDSSSFGDSFSKAYGEAQSRGKSSSFNFNLSGGLTS